MAHSMAHCHTPSMKITRIQFSQIVDLWPSVKISSQETTAIWVNQDRAIKTFMIVMSMLRISKFLSLSKLLSNILCLDIQSLEDTDPMLGCMDLGINLFEVQCDPSKIWSFDLLKASRESTWRLFKSFLSIIIISQKWSKNENLYKRRMSSYWI